MLKALIDANLRVMELQNENIRMRAALCELDWHNPLHNDFAWYLHELAQWGLGKIDKRPDPAEYDKKILVPDNIHTPDDDGDIDAIKEKPPNVK